MRFRLVLVHDSSNIRKEKSASSKPFFKKVKN